MLPSLIPLALLALAVDAALISFTEVRRPRFKGRPSRFQFLAAECDDDTCGQLGNIMDSIYVSNITIGGKVFNVLLDTGSADLWVNASLQPIPSAQILQDVIVSEVYGDQSNYTGPVAFDRVEFHEFTVTNQSFTYAIISENDNTADLNVTGLIGLSFDGLSNIQRAVQRETGSSTAGRTFLSNVFAENPSQPKYITFLLSRLADVNKTSNDGAFTISETVKGYDAINNETPIPLFPPDNEEWTVPMTEIRVGGRAITLPSSVVSNSPDIPSVGLLDTGTSNIIAPASIVSQVYSGISGARQVRVDSSSSLWVLPCDAEPPSVAFVIGGKPYFVNPLDLSPIQGTYSHNGRLVSLCLSGMLASSPLRNRFDVLLGSPFLRSAYTMFDFGDNSTSVRTPFIKILGTYDPSKQGSAFSDTRNAQLQLAPAASSSDILAILNGDPSYTAVDNPSLAGAQAGGGGSNSGGGGRSSASGRIVPIEAITVLAIGVLTISQLW